nr:uncharacterized protein LOC129152533 [Nothobranchius furzeri]
MLNTHNPNSSRLGRLAPHDGQTELSGSGVLLKEEAEASSEEQLQSQRVKNGCWTSEEMTGDSSLLAAVLTVVSVISLSLLSLLCLRCKKKSKIMLESQIYDPQIFQRGGSKFAVIRSKTVTRGNLISSDTDETLEQSAFQDGETEEQGDYLNITVPTVSSNLEHDYVAPIAVALYENQKNRTLDDEQTPGIYGNVFLSLSIEEDDDYENAAFLQQIDDEPDYVNENGKST